ncbi:hypothetical protein HY346_01955 [Candidatus Microgenomates bacterium]|nr:hypothetical protein [Candidatus Microgenomates bacterium]
MKTMESEPESDPLVGVDESLITDCVLGLIAQPVLLANQAAAAQVYAEVCRARSQEPGDNYGRYATALDETLASAQIIGDTV